MCLVCLFVVFFLKYFKIDIFRKKIIEFNDIYKYMNKDDFCFKKDKIRIFVFR